MGMPSSRQQAHDESLSMQKVIGNGEAFEDVLVEVSEWICTALAIASVLQGVFPQQVQITKGHDPADQGSPLNEMIVQMTCESLITGEI